MLAKAWLCLAVGNRGSFLRIAEDLCIVDPVAVLLTPFLYSYATGSSIRIVSPWIEDIEIAASPNLSSFLGIAMRTKLSQLVNQAIDKGIRIEIVTAPTTRDKVGDSRYRRTLLYTSIPLDIVRIDPRIHTKAIELDTWRLILTANLTEPELAKMRTQRNIATIQRTPT